MSALSLASASPHILYDSLVFSDTAGISLFVRYRDGQQEFYRHAKRSGKLLMQRDGAFSLAGFEIGQVTLCDANRRHEFGLSRALPFAQDADRIFASRQAIDDELGQHNLGTGSDCGARLAHNSGRTDILVGRQSGEPFVFALRQYGEFLAVGRFDELHLVQDSLSIVNFATVPNGSNDNCVALDVEDHPPITHPQPRPSTALEPLHVALSGLGKDSELAVDATPHIGGQSKPLARGRAGERDLHKWNIAHCDNSVKSDIALCDAVGLA